MKYDERLHFAIDHAGAEAVRGLRKLIEDRQRALFGGLPALPGVPPPDAVGQRAVTDLSPEQRAAFDRLDGLTVWDNLPRHLTLDQVPEMYRMTFLAQYGREPEPSDMGPGRVFWWYDQGFTTNDGKTWTEYEK